MVNEIIGMFDFFKNKKLERDKERLIAELKEGGIRHLIKQMDNDSPFSPIVEERRKKGSYSSEDSISWYAYRISNELDNPALKTELLNLFQEEDFQKYRRCIFCCLACLCTNISDYEIYNFLIKQIEKEEDERIVISILSRIEELVKPLSIDITVIKKLAVDGTHDIRKAALKALSNAEDKEVEDVLLSEFKVSDKHTKGMICFSLSTVGTRKSIPVLMGAYKKTRDPFLRHAIENAISEIETRENSKC